VRVLAAVVGSRGDVQPLLALGEALRAAGHELVVAAPATFASFVTARGFEHVATGGDLEALMREFGHPRALGYFKDAIRGQFHLVDTAKTCDVVVGSPLVMSFASVADAAGKPFVAALLSPQWLPSAHHSPPVHMKPQPAKAAKRNWWFLRASWNLLFRPLLNKERKARGLPKVKDAWGELLRERPLVAVDEALGPLPGDVDAVQTGAWILEDESELDADLARFLDDGPPPVFLGFGSMSSRFPPGTGQLLVDAAVRAGARAILLGWPEATLPGSVVRIESAPFAGLFPRCALVVHHGGAGTTATAARAGAPQLFVPVGADQFGAAAAARRAGIARDPVLASELSAEALGDAIRATLDDDEVRAAARALTVDDGGAARAVRHLESVVSGRG
jgi:vancomycin aglycone glucosyltransferase